MPNLPISQLPELTAITSNAEFVVAQNGTTHKIKGGYISSGNLYGSFYSNVDQTITANTPAAMSASTQDLSNGITVVNGSKFTVASGGTFNIQFSAQIKQGANSALMSIWFKKNGNDIPDSATQLDLQNNNSYVFALNFILQLAANEYVEIWWASNSSNTSIEHFPAGPNVNVLYTRPEIPSLIVTVTQV
jgi:hypothetical protein